MISLRILGQLTVNAVDLSHIAKYNVKAKEIVYVMLMGSFSFVYIDLKTDLKPLRNPILAMKKPEAIE